MNKAAAIGPSQWAYAQEEFKKTVTGESFIYPIAYTGDGTPYMDRQNLEETGKTEEVDIELPAKDKDGKDCKFTVKMTLAEYKYIPVKGDPVKMWFPIAPEQKSLQKLLEQNMQIQKLALAMRTYVDITLGTNPAVLNSGIPEIGLAHALALTGNEITKEVENTMLANFRGSLSPTEANKEIQNISSKINKNYINAQYNVISTKKYIKAIENVVKIFKEKNIDLIGSYTSIASRNPVLESSDMNPTVVIEKTGQNIEGIQTNNRITTGDSKKVDLF